MRRLLLFAYIICTLLHLPSMAQRTNNTINLDSVFAAARDRARTATPERNDVENQSLLKTFAPNTQYELSVIIKNAPFGDKNCMLLLSEIKKSESVRSASLYYKNEITVITTVQKGQATSSFWQQLPSSLTNVFSIQQQGPGYLLIEYVPTNNSVIANTSMENKTNTRIEASKAGSATTHTTKTTDTRNAGSAINQSGSMPPTNGEQMAIQNRYTEAFPNKKLGKEGAFIKFNRNAKPELYDELMIFITPIPPKDFLSEGVLIQVLDLRKDIQLMLCIMTGDEPLQTKKYSFSANPNKMDVANTKQPIKTPQVIFAIENNNWRNGSVDLINAYAGSLSTQYETQNLISGYVDIKKVMYDKYGVMNHVEGMFEFLTEETKNKTQNISRPAVIITEGRFAVITGGAPILIN